MDTKLTNRQYQALKTKENILHCALQLVKEIGFEKVTISSICKKANVSIGSFYHYFKSLDFIIIETYKYFDEILTNLDEQGHFNGNTINRIMLIVKEQLRYAEIEGVEIVTQFYKSQITVGNEYFLSFDRHLSKLILDAAKDGQKLGILDTTIDALEITNDILTISRGVIYDWCLKHGNFNLIEKGCKLTKVYLDSYLVNSCP
ncbi:MULTISPECIES: TetR/AcrR family transcriptional regulator [Clostridium]|uniref:TetR/AcrR family transcriptional regulator n=1 Tax=Clostridium aquiflavi TaxID=3073603 RepID=A0ABU1EGS5_9CLOT|nr:MULTISPECIES: TetR/AcrR family transcriptional regulator [unclassified Clostridium]MDR5587154.1 TetR/AcrR family transcriptional regulator [Clostridium sp. 5N-1]